MSSVRHSVCMWPECPIFAVTEIREGQWGKRPNQGWICLCTRHRGAFDHLTWGELESQPWQKRKSHAIRVER